MDLLGPYSNSTRKKHPGGAINNNNVSLTCMEMINTAMGWSEIVKIPRNELDEVAGDNDDYIDK